jgi:hypothetical protein
MVAGSQVAGRTVAEPQVVGRTVAGRMLMGTTEAAALAGTFIQPLRSATAPHIPTLIPRKNSLKATNGGVTTYHICCQAGCVCGGPATTAR